MEMTVLPNCSTKMSGPISAEDLDTLKRLVRDLEQQRKDDHP